MEWNGMEFLGFGADVYSEGERRAMRSVAYLSIFYVERGGMGVN